MANRRQSIKKIRVDKRRRERNKQVISELKTVARRLRRLVNEKKKPEAVQTCSILFSKLDKAVKKGVIHKNHASRSKSRLKFRVNTLEA